jgi:hypothetical protein
MRTWPGVMPRARRRSSSRAAWRDSVARSSLAADAEVPRRRQHEAGRRDGARAWRAARRARRLLQRHLERGYPARRRAARPPGCRRSPAARCGSAATTAGQLRRSEQRRRGQRRRDGAQRRRRRRRVRGRRWRRGVVLLPPSWSPQAASSSSPDLRRSRRSNASASGDVPSGSRIVGRFRRRSLTRGGEAGVRCRSIMVVLRPAGRRGRSSISCRCAARALVAHALA